jgi:hypothetical protein
MNRSVLCRLALVTLLVLTTTGCVDSGGFLNANNQTDATYVAQILNDEFRIIPPKSKLSLTYIGFAGDPKFEVRIFDAGCVVIGTLQRGQAVVLINATGIVVDTSSDADGGGQLALAQETRFCAPGGDPGLSAEPTAVP